MNLTIQRRSRAHVENSPPPEKLYFNKKSLARNIFILKTTKRKAVPLSSKRGTPPLQLFLISKFIRSLAKLYNRQRSSEICHLPFPICHSARPWHPASTFRTSHSALRTSFAISHLQFATFLYSLILKNSIISTAFEFVLFVIKVKSSVAAVGDSKGKFTFVARACVFPA